MDVSQSILSDITVFTKYAKFIPSLQRRETFSEICNRYENTMVERYPQLKEKIVSNMQFVREKKILPSMRGMQFSGPAVIKNESRIYNCAFLPIDDYAAFSETMFLLLGGTGVGYSVQQHHISKLPPITKATSSQKFMIEDSIEGWADAIKYLMKSYFGARKHKPRFDFSSIRKKGERLITAGGKAPGPEPLKRCLFLIEQILESYEDGQKLTSVSCHDILCHIADAVLSGGIRRAAMISLFSPEDSDMLVCKSGSWWELNPQRGRANNSIVLNRATTSKEEFFNIWEQIKASKSGEPGIYFTNDLDWGTNPCAEIALRPHQFCNLTEINGGTVKDYKDFVERAKVAAFFGTLQAGFTDFHYLRPIWKHTTEEEALIGVGITGIASGVVSNFSEELLSLAAIAVKDENLTVSRLIGIKPAARTTTVKPSGSTSCVLGTSSGIHAWYDKYYLRRMQFGPNESITNYLLSKHSDLIVPYRAIPGSYVLELPQKAPKGATLRDEGALVFLERVTKFNVNWVQSGHQSGINTNNVSATVNVMDEEWNDVGNWMWDNRNTFNGLSVLPYDTGTYEQAPFETITKQEYEERMSKLHFIDLTEVLEVDDNTTLSQELACAGGSCELP